MLHATPAADLVDPRGRPLFLWDCDLTLDELRDRPSSEDPDLAAYWTGKVMRQARPDDAVVLIGVDRMVTLWPRLERFLGDRRSFWRWLLFDRWGAR